MKKIKKEKEEWRLQYLKAKNDSQQGKVSADDKELKERITKLSDNYEILDKSFNETIERLQKELDSKNNLLQEER